MNEINMLG